MFTEGQLERDSIETLKELLEDKLSEYKIAIKFMLAYNPLLEGNTPLFRGVHCPLRPDTISRISYPQPDHVTTLQRASRIGQPRFYCSCASPGVFYELHAKQGDLIAWSRWEVQEPLWMYNIGYNPEALRRVGAQERNVALRWPVTHAIPDETPENGRISREVSEAFTTDVPAGKEYLYKLSIALNESFEQVKFEFPDDGPDLPRHKRIAGTVYPSMRMRGDADNIVLLPEFVRSSLALKMVQYVRVEAANEETSSYTFLTIAISNGFSDDNIEWMETLGPEDDRRCHIALENGHWVGRDGYNRLCFSK
jgi:hypothetical protein